MATRTRRTPERLKVPENPLDSDEKQARFREAQRVHAIPTLRIRERAPTPVQGVAEPLVMHHQMRNGLLPFIARGAGLAHKLDEIHAVYDAIMQDDLRYDLREGTPLPSGASGALSPFLMNMSLGARQDSALRYQCEPVVPRRALGGRSRAFKERLRQATGLGWGSYAVEKVIAAWVAAVPYNAMTLDNIRPSFGVRHYPDRPPDICAYFVLEHDDPRWSHDATRRALLAMGEAELWEQVDAFCRATFRELGLFILAVDLPADGSYEVKLYKRSEKIGRAQLQRLLDVVHAGPEGEERFREFRRTFVPSYVRNLIGGIGFVMDRGGRPPVAKIYLDTSMMYDDWEAVQRLSRWLTALGYAQPRDFWESLRTRLAPQQSLEGVGNFMDMVSLDVGAAGLFKTSLYYAPEVSLGRLAREWPRELPTWDGALAWDRT
ncbi:MAG: hypothetical protein AB2A00_11805 [Myxococcota bacterium]